MDKRCVDFIANKAQIIHQVVEYGLIADWHLIIKIYGLEEIADTAVTFRQLDAKALIHIFVIRNS